LVQVYRSASALKLHDSALVGGAGAGAGCGSPDGGVEAGGFGESVGAGVSCFTQT
jgi:hypothetical protein